MPDITDDFIEKVVFQQLGILAKRVGPKVLSADVYMQIESGECELCGNDGREVSVSCFYWNEKNTICPYLICRPCYNKIAESSNKWRIKLYGQIEEKIIKKYNSEAKKMAAS